VAGGVAAEPGIRRNGRGVDNACAVNWDPINVSEDLSNLAVRYERLQLLHQVSNIIHSTLEPQEALQLIVNEAVRVMRANSGSVALVNPTSNLLEIHASQNLPAAAMNLKLHVGQGITGLVVRTGKPMRIGNVTGDAHYVAVRPGIKSELAVPFEVNGEVRGVLNVDSDREDAFGPEDQELLEELAAQAAKVIHNTWLYEQLRLKAGQFQSLASISRTINSTLNLDEALQVITREAQALMNTRMCALMMLDDSLEWLDLRAHNGAGSAYLKKPRLKVEDSALGIVVRRKKPLQIFNVQADARYQNKELARREHLVSLLSVPLIFSDQAIGTLSVYSARPYRFSNDEVRILSALAELSAIAIEKARLYERVVDVEEQLRQNERLSALGLLAAEVAHEIRNPLTVMKLLYHSLDLKFPDSDPRAKDVRIIGSKIEHLNKIVEQILAFARTTEPQLSPLNLNELVDELGLLVRHKLANQNVRLVRKLQPDLPLVMGDAPQLEQAFLNLILNAAEAMPDGGTLTIKSHTALESRSRSAQLHVALEFKDTGKGMSKEMQERAFKGALTTDKSKGTGLGLAILGRIIENHHGKINIKSQPNSGTLVRVLLPLK
jgi:signal transduction histidine kinase